MPDATLRARARLNNLQVPESKANLMMLDSTVETASAVTAGTEYVFARIPTNARIHGSSFVSWDDLASTGAPTLDFGFKPVNGNATIDIDSINDGLTLATATANARLIKDFANNGRMAWELHGLTSDPGGFFDLIGTTQDADTNAAGTITVYLAYSID